MKQIILLALLFVCLFSCENRNVFLLREISKVEIENILIDSLLDVRALEINEGRVVASSSSGDVYRSSLDYMKDFGKVNYWVFTEDSLIQSNFRSMSLQGDYLYTLSIGNPAKLFSRWKISLLRKSP